jgi:hypothetical protein
MSLKKLLICPYFGPFPEWMDLFIADFMRTMQPQGYSILIDTDLPAFKERVKNKLGIDCPIVRGTGKVWDYRGSFGVLYSEEIKGFDFYGHCDFDVVWGNISKFVPDSLLETLDVYSSHNEYVCGAFSLYRNHPFVNNLFMQYPMWKDHLDSPEPTGWIEQSYSRTLELSGLRYKYDLSPQGNPFTDTPNLKKEGDLLFQVTALGWKEVGLFHFRRSKRWPLYF